MELGAPELLLILLIVILMFGVGRIGKIAGELGSGIKAFKDGLKGDEDNPVPIQVKEQEVVQIKELETQQRPSSDNIDPGI